MLPLISVAGKKQKRMARSSWSFPRPRVSTAITGVHSFMHYFMQKYLWTRIPCQALGRGHSGDKDTAWRLQVLGNTPRLGQAPSQRPRKADVEGQVTQPALRPQAGFWGSTVRAGWRSRKSKSWRGGRKGKDFQRGEQHEQRRRGTRARSTSDASRKLVQRTPRSRLSRGCASGLQAGELGCCHAGAWRCTGPPSRAPSPSSQKVMPPRRPSSVSRLPSHLW